MARQPATPESTNVFILSPAGDYELIDEVRKLPLNVSYIPALDNVNDSFLRSLDEMQMRMFIINRVLS